MISMSIWTNIVSDPMYAINRYIVQYYLPPANQVNKDFLRQVFADEKKLFKKKNVDFIHVPQWDELSVKNMWKDLKDDATFNIYFQNKFAADKGPCRKYFFDILNTVYPEFLSQIMTHASKQRFAAEGSEAR